MVPLSPGPRTSGAYTEVIPSSADQMFPDAGATFGSNVLVTASAPHEYSVLTAPDANGPVSLGPHDHTDAGRSGRTRVAIAALPTEPASCSGVPKFGLVVIEIGTV